MKRMLINATHTDEIRVAIADGQKLYDLDIDSAGHYRKKGNIYKAKITRVEPSLEACFVNYGSERHGFLPYKEVSPAYCRTTKGKGRPTISEALKEGDEIIVQVNKEERGNKGAALTTYISLAGRYLVYMPGNQRAGGISRQIRGDKRAHLQDIMRRLEIPGNDGVIIRTAGLGRTFEELHWDFNYLQQVWEAIQKAAEQKKGPFFIYQESDLFIRALRDYLQPDIGEILIDDRESYEKAREFMQQVMPHNLKKLSYYNDTTPLFSRYQIERQIQSAFEREVKLPSGGALVIDQTEALLSIDINSAKATKGVDVETTALNTNLEAADEIARQLKIRDLGGLVVIDFIDMRNHKNQREVENRMRDAAESDRARVQIGKISKFGLLEMSRQRLRSSISDSSQITCPTCGGHGYIRSMESLVISIIRLTEEEMIKPKTGRVIIQAPVDITNKILNEKRTELSELETRHNVQVSVISNDNLSFPDFHVQRLNTNESHISIDSIKLVKPEDCHKPVSLDPPAPTKEQPALSMVKPATQAPKRSLALAITSWFKGLFSNKGDSKKKKATNKKPYHKNSQRNQGKHKPDNRKHPHTRTAANKNNQQTKAQPQKSQKTKKQQQNPQQNQQTSGQKSSPNKPSKANNAQANQTNQQPKQTPVNSKPKGGKSIYGNKNKKKPQENKPDTVNQDPDNKSVNNKMTRPLGSVADLAAKKEPVVPSGAMKKRPIDDIDVKEQNGTTSPMATNKPEAKKPEAKKPEAKKPE
ncbi:MAG: Rne/Rng family ribonuclease, partial [Xanthomonadales bacterium]|nr:Rne/Rng family ribonuclease [Xanthomonadales bacterium]